jgi:hypothetical protein
MRIRSRKSICAVKRILEENAVKAAGRLTVVIFGDQTRRQPVIAEPTGKERVNNRHAAKRLSAQTNGRGCCRKETGEGRCHAFGLRLGSLLNLALQDSLSVG